MADLKIGLLEKKRGNFAIQEKLIGAENVIDDTGIEVTHHEQALIKAGYNVQRIHWGPDFMRDLQASKVDLVFNVSSLVEAAILEELGIPYVGSNSYTIAIATDKSLAKRLWQQAHLPTSPFFVVRRPKDCEIFKETQILNYPLFLKPLAGRGSAGISEDSIVHDYDHFVQVVTEEFETLGQPVLVENYLQGREITVGILGNRNARALPPLEIIYREGDHTLSYDKKSKDNDTFLCPAPLSERDNILVQELALEAYRVLNFKDYGRIDMILTDEGPFLLEGNTFAGLTCLPEDKPISYIGFMAHAEGMGGKELLDEIIQVAAKRLRITK